MNTIAPHCEMNKMQLLSNRTWFPPIEDWVPLKKSKNSTLRIATIVGNRLFSGLVFEGELLPLTQHNWKQVIRYAKPDILLVESLARDASGCWRTPIDTLATDDEMMIAIISGAKENSIQTVFWHTQDHNDIARYLAIAKHFDLVCCADPLTIAAVAKDGIKAESLLPCVQPALYNPFRHYEHKDCLNLGILYDGWADISQLREILSVLQKIKSLGLHIIESRLEQFDNELNNLSNLDDCILGCASTAGRLNALKYARSYASHNSTLSTPVEQQWLSLEAAASRLPVVHCGTFDVGDMRKDFVIECPSDMEFQLEYMRYREDDLYRERLAHLGWRYVNQKHTFSHRLQRICRFLNIEHDWVEHPQVSIITPTFRREMFHRIASTYNSFTYQNKELIIVFNGDVMPDLSEFVTDKQRADVKIINVPNENFAGATLNCGHKYASGDFCFRVDDDDYYGSNYITDMIYLVRCIDADLFGKPPVPVAFEGESSAYARKDGHPLTLVPLSILRKGNIWFGGNTIAGTKEFFSINPYDNRSYGAADTAMVLGISSKLNAHASFMDRFNVIAERRSDVSSHTWIVDKGDMIKNRVKCDGLSDLFI